MANTKKYVSLDKLELYDDKIKGVISDGDEAALASAKAYADGLASNYEAAGAAATAAAGALADAKVYADNAANAKDAAIQAAQKAADDAAAAAGVADGKAVAAQGDVDALETYVGTFEHATAKSVVEYIDAKTAGIATDAALESLTERVTQAEKDIDAVEADYLKAADKEELAGEIAKKADKTALDEVSAVANAAVKQADYDVKVAALDEEDARIAELVADETEARIAADEAMDARLVEVEAFFKLAEGEQLDTALDTLKEIQTYITGEGAAADQMVQDIAANAKAIEDEAKARAEADEALDGRLDVLEAINHEAYVAADAALKSELEGKINAKADASALTQALEAQAGVDAGQNEKIAALEAKFTGDGSVEDMIADAKQEAIDTAAGDATTKANKALEDAKAYADAEDAKIESRVDALEAASATHALAADLTALAGRVTTAEGEIDTLQSEMDAVEALAAANKAAHEANAAAIALKASQEDLGKLDARVVTLETWHNNFTECSEEEINKLFQ